MSQVWLSSLFIYMCLASKIMRDEVGADYIIIFVKSALDGIVDYVTHVMVFFFYGKTVNVKSVRALRLY